MSTVSMDWTTDWGKMVLKVSHVQQTDRCIGQYDLSAVNINSHSMNRTAKVALVMTCRRLRQSLRGRYTSFLSCSKVINCTM